MHAYQRFYFDAETLISDCKFFLFLMLLKNLQKYFSIIVRNSCDFPHTKSFVSLECCTFITVSTLKRNFLTLNIGLLSVENMEKDFSSISYTIPNKKTFTEIIKSNFVFFLYIFVVVMIKMCHPSPLQNSSLHFSGFCTQSNLYAV